MEPKQKMGKKERKKQKAQDKRQEGDTPLNSKTQQQQKLAGIEVSYQKVPIIRTHAAEGTQSKDSSKRIVARNKKLQCLEEEVFRVLEQHGMVQIVGTDSQIPKSISLVEMVKRKLQSNAVDYKQENVLGRNQNGQACLSCSVIKFDKDYK